ncbi:MAG: glycerol-3-phosphate 1-O-acyltransferase PlsY [Limnochordia bacterium]|jgi:glycerol-3-phosphate acyltransferase PlsY
MHWLILLLAYAVGSIPTGYIVVWITRRINIQTVGSGNIGSTNVGRVAGRRAALFTQAVDVLKGVIPTVIAIMWNRSHPTPYLVEGAALLTILGHDFTPYLRFRGGKGVNTTLGAFIPMFPFAAVLAFVTHFVVRKTLRVVSVASFVAGVAFVLAAWLIYGWNSRTWTLVLAWAVMMWQHRSNIARLLQGVEPREQ